MHKSIERSTGNKIANSKATDCTDFHRLNYFLSVKSVAHFDFVMISYIPHSEDEIKEMLEAVGVKSIEELFSDIPDSLRSKDGLSLPESLSEIEIESLARDIADENISTSTHISFLGGGSYDHYIPALVDTIASRPEFYTAYTPYQAEVSQGTLQTLYEYQSLICDLVRMDVSNASMYDGATALAEAVLMATSINGKRKILVSGCLHPHYIDVIKTYVQKERVEEIPVKDGKTSINVLNDMIDKNISSVVIQHPNFFGVLEDTKEIGEIVHRNNALYIGCPLPISLGVLEPPGDYGADIVACEGQTLGIPQQFGGPYLGIFATKREYTRKMPGRIIGETIDGKGKRGFVMTLQTREQHIRREKATSNICTNESLCAIRACVYMALMGKEGMRRVGELCIRGAHILAEEIENIPSFDIKYKPFFNEFVVSTPIDAELIVKKLMSKGIFAGIPLGRFYKERKNELLVAVTEKRTDKDIDYFVEVLEAVAIGTTSHSR